MEQNINFASEKYRMSTDGVEHQFYIEKVLHDGVEYRWSRASVLHQKSIDGAEHQWTIKKVLGRNLTKISEIHIFLINSVHLNFVKKKKKNSVRLNFFFNLIFFFRYLQNYNM